MDSARPKNIVGPQVRCFRKNQKLTTADLAARCTRVGFQVESYVISRIERGIRTVSDLEMVLLAEALRVDLRDLVPEEKPSWKKDTRPPNASQDDE